MLCLSTTSSIEAVGGSGVGIDERRVTRQQRTACVGDRMVKSPKMKEMTKKLKAIEFKTTYERDKESF